MKNNQKETNENVSLREFFEEKLVGIEKANVLALETVKLARELDSKALDKRLDTLNHFKEEQVHLTSTFLSQDRYEMFHNQLSDKITTINNQLSDKITTINSQLNDKITNKENDLLHEKIAEELQILKDAKIKAETIASEAVKIAEGKASKKTVNVAIIIAVISGSLTFLGIIVAIILHFVH
jgi:hypothetical protein